jgi:hypothetical protein
MNMDKVNQWLSLLGNLGVVAGIIFLAIELQNNTRATEAQTRNSMTENLVSWQMAIGSDEYTAQTWVKGNNQIDQLTQVERAAYGQIVQSIFRNWENEWYQYQTGLFSEEEFLPRIGRMERAISFCSYQQIWGDGSAYSVGLRELVNGFIAKAQFEECN